MDLIQYLADLLVQHPNLKAEDEAVVSRICEILRLEDNEGMINIYISSQVEAEAGAIYLVGRYRDIWLKLATRLNEERAEKRLDLGDRDEDGRRWTKQSREDWLLANDAKYVIQLENVTRAEQLVKLLEGLSNIVFGRQDKLRDLAANYRRELRTDRNSN